MANTADTAADAAANAAYAAVECWRAVSSDMGWLDNEGGEGNNVDAAQELGGFQLWKEGEPAWIAKARKHLFSLQYENIQVWQHWYERVLAGREPFGFGAERDEKLAVKIALQGDKFWDREFGAVNKDISDWVEEARIEFIANEKPPEPVPRPGPQYGPKDGQVAGRRNSDKGDS